MLTVAHDNAAPRPAPLEQKVWTIISGLVHDVRQPLSVIEACADYLDLVLPAADLRARRQLELLQQQVGDANRILHDALLKLDFGEMHAASAFARAAYDLPEPEPCETPAGL